MLWRSKKKKKATKKEGKQKNFSLLIILQVNKVSNVTRAHRSRVKTLTPGKRIMSTYLVTWKTLKCSVQQITAHRHITLSELRRRRHRCRRGFQPPDPQEPLAGLLAWVGSAFQNGVQKAAESAVTTSSGRGTRLVAPARQCFTFGSDCFTTQSADTYITLSFSRTKEV